MRRWVLRVAIVTPALLLGAVACVDLFHGTDVPTLCDVDASAPGCAGPVAADLCSPDAGVAQDRAVHACSWLATCESPIGHNATGSCMVDAILAFDCAANPNRKPKLSAKAYWSCLDKAKSCADVHACTMPEGRGNCTTAGFIGCYPNNDNPRVQCLVSGVSPAAENCAARGQVCDSIGGTDGGNNNAVCVGAKRRNCTVTGCNGSSLAACDDAGLDHGTDCSLFGEGSCITTGAQPACKPEGSNPWPATTDINCTGGGVAQGSASGFLETVDCTAISGLGTCTKVTNAPPGTPVVSACQGTSGCSVDTCGADGGALVACVAGRSVPVNCVALGLNPCDDTVPTLEGTRAACRKP